MKNRTPQDSDFSVDVNGVGLFRFARRTFGDRIRIRGEMSRLLAAMGIADLASADPMVASDVGVVAAYKVLMVSCPSGWEDVEAIDLAERPEAEDQIIDIYLGLKAAEDRFRTRADARSQVAGQNHGQDDGVLVPGPVPPQSV